MPPVAILAACATPISCCRTSMVEAFDPACRRCPRLASFLDEVRAKHADYHAAPVPAFGVAQPGLLVVGLAPGMHGANRTGRPFTGDHAGLLLYQALYAAGFSDRAESLSRDDGLQLRDCRITNAVRCLPPANKPLPIEMHTCNGFLAHDLAAVPSGGAILALGRVAHEAVLRALGLRTAAFAFGHGAEHDLGAERRLFDSYHCSRYNTQTRRLTTEMFAAVVGKAGQWARDHHVAAPR